MPVVYVKRNFLIAVKFKFYLPICLIVKIMKTYFQEWILFAKLNFN